MFSETFLFDTFFLSEMEPLPLPILEFSLRKNLWSTKHFLNKNINFSTECLNFDCRNRCYKITNDFGTILFPCCAPTHPSNHPLGPKFTYCFLNPSCFLSSWNQCCHSTQISSYTDWRFSLWKTLKIEICLQNVLIQRGKELYDKKTGIPKFLMFFHVKSPFSLLC